MTVILPTLGAKVSKKAIDCSLEDRAFHATLDVWDIMGTPSFRELLRDAYFQSTQGILARADASRPPTIGGLTRWAASVRRVAGPVPVVMLANKTDLLLRLGPVASTMERMADRMVQAWFPTSAKTGENVERAFEGIVTLVLTPSGQGGGFDGSLNPRRKRGPGRALSQYGYESPRSTRSLAAIWAQTTRFSRPVQTS